MGSRNTIEGKDEATIEEDVCAGRDEARSTTRILGREPAKRLYSTFNIICRIPDTFRAKEERQTTALRGLLSAERYYRPKLIPFTSCLRIARQTSRKEVLYDNRLKMRIQSYSNLVLPTHQQFSKQ